MIQIKTLKQAQALHSLKGDERFQILQEWILEETNQLMANLVFTQDLDLLRQQQGALQVLNGLALEWRTTSQTIDRLRKQQ